MNIIQSSLEKKGYISANDKLKQQSWDDFYKTSYGKRVFLFGLGAAGSYFFLNYHNKVKLDGVIDNDSNKQGNFVGELVAEAVDTDYEDIIISDISVLDRYKPEEIVVLISSTKYYSSIIEQLEQRGIINYYVLLMMEANRRKEDASRKDVCRQGD